MVPILGENGRKYNISTKKYNILRPHLFDISWFKRQSLTFMILKYRFNSFREACWPRFCARFASLFTDGARISANLLQFAGDILLEQQNLRQFKQHSCF